NVHPRFDSVSSPRQISRRRLTRLLQRLYLQRTPALPPGCSMQRCERKLTVLVPNLNMKVKRMILCLLAPASLWATAVGNEGIDKTTGASPETDLLVREVAYDGKLSDEEARFQVELTLESKSKHEISQTLFEGELALLPPKLPAALRIERRGNQYRVFVSNP